MPDIILPENTLLPINDTIIINEPILPVIGKKAALVNIETEIVENIIMVNSLEDPVDDGYKLVEIPIIVIEYTQEEQELYELLQQIDPEFIPPVKKTYEQFATIGTKWNVQNGFFEE